MLIKINKNISLEGGAPCAALFNIREISAHICGINPRYPRISAVGLEQSQEAVGLERTK